MTTPLPPPPPPPPPPRGQDGLQSFFLLHMYRDHSQARTQVWEKILREKAVFSSKTTNEYFKRTVESEEAQDCIVKLL